MDLGVRFIVEPSGTRLTAEERSALSDLRPAGIMLRRRNFLQDVPYETWLDEYRSLISDVRDAIGRESVFVTIDHEGGKVHRFPPPITRFPYPAFYGASLEAVESVGVAMGKELASLGINLSYSPVADIHSNPSNPVINQRAFGRTADEVSERTVVFARALRAQGVIPCAKHFPGHGDTSVDSHYALPVIDKSLDELFARELKPFESLIDDGIEMVMSAHIVLPQLDSANQATLSRIVMTDLLRDQLGFGGVSIADALGMKAIVDDVNSESFAARAHAAGIDLLLFVGDPVTIQSACAARDSFARTIATGAVDEQSLRESQQRIDSLLARAPAHAVTALSPEALAHHAGLAVQLAAGGEWDEFDFDPQGFG